MEEKISTNEDINNMLNYSHPYAKYFFLRNRDPYNDVLYKDFYLYSIFMIYIFYFWYIVATMENHEYLLMSTKGTAIYYITGFVAGLTLLLLMIMFIQKNYPNNLAGIVFILLIISMSICLFTFDLYQIDPRFEKDPSSLAAAFLITYSFVSYFFTK